MCDDCSPGLSRSQEMVKRSFDLIVSLVMLILVWWIILIGWLLVSLTTKGNGFFTQRRVGRHGRYFNMIKIRTMTSNSKVNTTVTCSDDPRITLLGRMLRRSKLDELPQLWNVLVGDMSLVGPRPDVPSFADQLIGNDRVILSIRPGITGPASLKYNNEEELLAGVSEPEDYNRNVIYPDKVRINIEYIHNWSLLRDVRYLIKTVL